MRCFDMHWGMLMVFCHVGEPNMNVSTLAIIYAYIPRQASKNVSVGVKLQYRHRLVYLIRKGRVKMCENSREGSEMA